MDQAGRGDGVEQWIARAAVMTQNMDRADRVDDAEYGSRG